MVTSNNLVSLRPGARDFADFAVVKLLRFRWQFGTGFLVERNAGFPVAALVAGKPLTSRLRLIRSGSGGGGRRCSRNGRDMAH